MRLIYTLKSLFVVVLLVSALSASSQEIVGWTCKTENTGSLSTAKTLSELKSSSFDTHVKIINVFVHVIKRTDGTGGLTNTQVSNWISLLCNDYSQYNIAIRVIGQSDLNNTTFYNGITDISYPTLISTNSHSDAIDIYLLSPSDPYSRASNIPGGAFSVGGIHVGTSVISHEFGHCIGLYHTHSGRGCGDLANCSENIDGSNCTTCGDLVCDTPADPCLGGQVNSSCVYTGGGGFSPDANNIMSYSLPVCLNSLTNGQRDRFHATIIGNPSIFSARSYRPSISGSELLCTSSTYSVSNIPSGVSVSWSALPSGIVSFSNPTSTSTSVTRNFDGKVTIVVTVNSGCGSGTVSKTVWAGLPNIVKKLNNEIIDISSAPVSPGSMNILETLTDSPFSGMTFSKTNFSGTGDMYIIIHNPNFQTSSVEVSNSSTNGYRVLKMSATNTCGTTEDEIVLYLMSFFKSVYPNPAKDYLSIEFNSLIDKMGLPDVIELYQQEEMKKEMSITVDELLKDSKNIQDNKYIVDIRNLKRGVWYLQGVKKGFKTEVIRLLFE